MPRFDLTRAVLTTAGPVTAVAALFAQTGEPRLTADAMAPFAFRSVGPSLTTGRISDVAVDPRNPSVWYVAASAGNLWKTENRGNTWTPPCVNGKAASLAPRARKMLSCDTRPKATTAVKLGIASSVAVR